MIWLLIPIVSTTLFIIIFLYFPGKIITQFLKFPQTFDWNIVIGLTIFLPFVFFGRYLLPLWLLFLIYLLIFVILTIKLKINFQVEKIKPRISIIVIIALGTIAQSWTYLSSGFLGLKNLILNLLTSHDQSWHMALVNELVKNFPPQIPGFAGETLYNYHYFYDLFIAANVWVSKANVAVLLQFIFPVLISIFFGLAIYRLSAFLIKSKILQLLVVFISYFANNLSYLWYFLGAKQWQSDSLLLDQPIIYLFNHQTVISLSLFIYGLLMLNIWIERKYQSQMIALLVLFLITLAGIKIYAFVIFTISLFLIILIKIMNIYFYDKNNLGKYIKRISIFGLSFMLLFSLFYILSFRGGNAFISWNPGWIVEQFFIRNILPYFKQISSTRAIYQLLGNDFKLFLLDSLLAVIFLVTNFQLRIWGLFGKKKNLSELFLFIASLVSIFMVLFFNQKNSPFNIIQFAPYAMISLSILMLVRIDNLKNKSGKIILIFLCLLLSLPTSIKTISSYRLNNLESYVDISVMDALVKLKTLPERKVLILDQDLSLDLRNKQKEIYRGNNVVGSYADKRTYFWDKTQLEVLNLNFAKREDFVQELSDNYCNLDQELKDELRQEEIVYIVVPNTHKCGSYKLIYDNKDLAIFQVD